MNRRKAISGLGVLIGGTLLGSKTSLHASNSIEATAGTEEKYKSVRKKKTLSDNWKFQVDIKDIGEEEKWFNLEYVKCDWSKVHVPQAWDTYEEALWQYEGIGWYMTTIDPDDFSRDKRTQLIFNRVMYYSKVWLNGQYLGENIGGYLRFDFDITRFLKAGTPNILVIRVDNKPRIEWLPAAEQIEWIQYGGILEPVELIGTTHIFIEDFCIITIPKKGTAQIDCTVNIVNQTDASSEMEIEVVISRGAQIINKKERFKCPSNESTKISVHLMMDHIDLWSPDTPVLYTATASLKRENVIIDDLTERFGIRTITTEGEKILLNGKPLYIKGVHRYENYGRLGPTVPEKLVREELLLMKSVGINLIRVHYPLTPNLLSLYDEYGFLMMEEVPLNWWGNNMEQSMDILDQAKPVLTKMIKRDKNHPCIIIWSMSNECVTDSKVGIAVMRDLLIQAKSLDPTRLVTFVTNGDPVKQLAYDKADIICINKYYGTLQGNICKHISDIEEFGYKPFVDNVTRHCKELPGKPMIVSEFGAQGIKNIHGDVYYSEEFQSSYIERIWDGIKSVQGLSGGVLWCWADYYHRKYLITYAAFGPYGVVTTERKPKKSLDALTRMYKGSRPVIK